MPSLRVLVTRPQPQAARWAGRLTAAGIDAVALPLIAIADAPDPDAVNTAWRGLADRRLIVFVSPNAVAKFFAARPALADWPASIEAASIGPGTTEALKQLGVPADRIVEPAVDALQFDSEALWQRLGDASRAWSGASVLIVRGNGGRDWLADRLRERGAEVATLSAYSRVAPTFEGELRDVLGAALDRPRDHLWLLSSSEAIDHLQRAVPDHDWTEARAIATHPRIAASARSLGFGRVEASQATFEAVTACLEARMSACIQSRAS